jgi:hypothetical protein
MNRAAIKVLSQRHGRHSPWSPSGATWELFVFPSPLHLKLLRGAVEKGRSHLFGALLIEKFADPV